MTQKEQQLQGIILQTKEWFDNKVSQLNQVIEKNEDSKIFFENKNGDKVELPEEHKKGFIMGIQLAIEVLGKFPVNIS